MSLSVVSGPAVEPIDVESVKRVLRIDHADEDVDIEDWMIQSAREFLEGYLHRRLITQTLDQTWDYVFPQVLSLDVLPVQSVTSVTYVDADGATQTLATSVYTADVNSTPARIFEAYDEVWPTARAIRNAVTVRYVAGYGAAGLNVPAQLRHAVHLLVGDAYENRENTVMGAMSELPMGAKALMGPFTWI